MTRWSLLLVTWAVTTPAVAQLRASDSVLAAPAVLTGTTSDGRPSTAPIVGAIVVDPETKLPIRPPSRELFQLVAANVATPPATVFGGTYVVSQTCASYGTLTVRYRGPDGSTMLPLLTKNTADTGGATVVSLGSAAVVDVALTGTAGCYVQLARVP